MKLLLLGKTGQLGWELQRTLLPLGELLAPARGELNLLDEEAVRRAVRTYGPDWIINATAYNKVEKAEEESSMAMAINALAPGILAEEAERCGALLVHFSTDYLFDGRKSEPYTEEDRPNPLNFYGETKLAGEMAIRETGAAHLILRTSWLYGLRGSNFFLTFLRLLAEKDQIKIVDDQVGTPNWSRFIAQAAAAYLATGQGQSRALSESENREATRATYHLSAGGEVSWYAFANAIFKKLPREKLAAARHSSQAQDAPSLAAFFDYAPTITAVSSKQYRSAVKRPPYSVLSPHKFEKDTGFIMPGWQEVLDLALTSDTPLLL